VGFLIEIPTSFTSIEKFAKKKKKMDKTLYWEAPTKRNRAGTPDFLLQNLDVRPPLNHNSENASVLKTLRHYSAKDTFLAIMLWARIRVSILKKFENEVLTHISVAFELRSALLSKRVHSLLLVISSKSRVEHLFLKVETLLQRRFKSWTKNHG